MRRNSMERVVGAAKRQARLAVTPMGQLTAAQVPAGDGPQNAGTNDSLDVWQATGRLNIDGLSTGMRLS